MIGPPAPPSLSPAVIQKLLRTRFCSGIRLLCRAALVAALSSPACSQEISFHHLNIAEGAPDNHFIHAATDHTGLLWVGSRSGLASFDGIDVQRYTTRSHPELPSDAVTKCVVDKHNNIWLATDRGLAVLDARRRMHRVWLPSRLRGKSITQLFWIESVGILVRVGPRGVNGWYTLSTRTLRWRREHWLDAIGSDLGHAVRYDNNRILLCKPERLRLVDISLRRVLHDIRLRHTACCRGADGGIWAAAAHTAGLYRISMDGGVRQSFLPLTDGAGAPLNGVTLWMSSAADSSLFLSTRAKGLYRYFPSSGRLRHYTHDPFNPRSISDNRMSGPLLCDNGGLLVVLTTSGADYASLSGTALSYAPYFLTADGRRIEEPVHGIAEDSSGALWISTATHFLRIDARGAVRSLLSYPGDERSDYFGEPAVAADGRIWVPVRGEGIAVFSAKGELLRWLRKPLLPTVRVRFLKPVGGGWIAAGTETKGIFRIHGTDLRVDTFAGHPLLNRIQPKRVIDVLPEGDSAWWIATSTAGAAWRYDFRHRKLVALRPENGLLSERVYGLGRDSSGALYVATFSGLTVYRRSGRAQQHSIASGLMHDRMEGLVNDSRGRVWATNYRVLLRFDTGGLHYRQLDERAGIPGVAFNVVRPCRRKDGSLVFATERGILTVPPDAQENISSTPPAVHLFREGAGGEVSLHSSSELELPSQAAEITFHFRVAGITSAPRSLFRHRMEGLDDAWSAPTEVRSVTYNLKPGDYRFHVQASADGQSWRGTTSPAIHVPKPWWAQTLSIASWIALGIVGVYAVVRARVHGVKRRARLRQEVAIAREASLQQQLELQQVITYFATTIGAKTSVDEILWDVARHCIAQLGLEDCVIYLVDDADGTLHQRAAWGPKTTEENKIVNPIAIPPGRGITGAAASTGKSILVPDTTVDPRYIVDDARRGSELAIPIISSSGVVMGVIDSEHPRPHFYTDRHLLILSTIAALCADKIEKLQAEQHARAKEVEVLTISKDLAHSQLTALRSQMNPHFLFNSLNAIQECVVTGEVDSAYNYLSRFSRLLRLVLRHSGHDFISLGEEVEVTDLYLSLEALRLRHQFSYDIVVEPSLDADDVRVPSLLLQPFVENAVWHGLMYKEGEKRLRISFREDDDTLICEVEDNGVGRAEAARIRTARLAGKGQESVGTKLSQQKLQLLQSRYGIAARLEIEDLCNQDGSAAGTRVTVTIPATN